MEYELVVAGAGHAGCEAALAAARMGVPTLLLTLHLDAVAMMPCNPSIGGTGKGHLVREIDALGGEMGCAIDDVFLQSRMLNTGKGPAVHSLRAQADKKAYRERMLHAVLFQPNLEVRQAEVCDVVVEHGSVCAVKTSTGETIPCRAAILSTGVYLKSRIIIGEASWDGGPQGLCASLTLSPALERLGFALRRFKTGTPARVDGPYGAAARRRPRHAVFVPDAARAQKPRAVLSDIHQRADPPHHPCQPPPRADVLRRHPRHGRALLPLH